MAARNQLLGMAAKDPILVAVRPNGQEDTPQFSIDVDTVHAGALGLAMADVNATLSAAWGSAYVNDFIDKAGEEGLHAGRRTCSVWSPRTCPSGRCNAQGDMVPFSGCSRAASGHSDRLASNASTARPPSRSRQAATGHSSARQSRRWRTRRTTAAGIWSRVDRTVLRRAAVGAQRRCSTGCRSSSCPVSCRVV